MPTTNARKHVIPAGPEASFSRATIFAAFANSIRDVVPVANATDRTSVVNALTTAGQGPTSARPLFVYRHDAPGVHRLEYSVDGSVWVPASGVLRFASKSSADTWGTSNSAYLSVGDTAFVDSLELTWTGTQWVGDWRDVGAFPGSEFTPFGAGFRFRRIGSTVFFNASGTKASPWGNGHSVAAVPVDHRPAYQLSFTSIYGDVSKEVYITPGGGLVIARAGSVGITVSGSYPVG